MDDVIILSPSKAKSALLFLISAVFLAIGVWMISRGFIFGWVVAALSGLGLLVSLYMLVPGTMQLRVDRDGIEMKSPFRPLKLAWQDVDGFYVASVSNTKMIGINYSRTYGEQLGARRFSAALTGLEGALPNQFDRSPEQVCQLLNDAKIKWGGRRHGDQGVDDQPRLFPESFYVVRFSESDVSCTHPDGTIESVAWDDLQQIEIVTTDHGPFHPDVFWVLHGSMAGCVVPQGATGHRELLERLQRLPGFRNEAVIEAMTSTENRRFLCWEKRGDAEPGAAADRPRE